MIEDQGLVWKFVLNAIILTTRPRRKGRDYEKIWNRERNESPLKTITRSQADKLRAALDGRSIAGIVVDWAMRYGNPSLASRLEALAKLGCERILLVPLYPQYAAATTATVCDAAFATLAKLRFQPALRVVPPYYDDPVYIDALAASIEAELETLPFKPEMILASFHGIPKSYADDGDPYPAQCTETVRLLRERLGLDESKLMLTFQSRFGRAEWLQPYTDETVKSLAQARREESRGGDAGLRRRLPGDAGGDRGRERRHLQGERRRELRRDSLPQRQRGGHGAARPSGAARAAGLGLTRLKLE